MKNYRILLVDDLFENLETIVNIFDEHHPEYTIYQTGKSKYAFEIARKEIPDLIITDWDMPGLNGIDLIKLLKKGNRTRDIPIIIATGIKLTSEDLKMALEAGAVDYVRKPIDPVELLARTNSALMIANYFKQSIDAKNHELTENALYLIKNNEFNIEITKKLQLLNDMAGKNNEAVNKLLNEIISDIDYKIKGDSWHRFNLAFETVHVNFNKNLMDQFPDLTPTELKLCAFLRLGMNTKDIASVLYQSPDSIKVARSRLRKKLGLPQDRNLLTFLSPF